MISPSHTCTAWHAGALVALAFAFSTTRVEAGAGNVPCTRPFIFSGAAVNVVVLPYESAPQLSSSGGLGERLAGLLQLELLRSIAKFGSVGAVQMVGAPKDCQPDVVIAKLLGQSPGAAATVRKGHGLIVVWGRIFNEGGNVFVQTFSRMLRFGRRRQLRSRRRRPTVFGAAVGQGVCVCAPKGHDG